MLNILKSLQGISDSPVDECPPDMPAEMPMQQQAPSINLQLNDPSDMAKLLQALQSINSQAPEAVNAPEESYVATDDMMSMGDDLHAEKHPADIRVKDNAMSHDIEEYANEPEEEYSDHDMMLNKLSGGLNRKKKAYAAAQDGDNAMAVETIKATLLKALAEKKK